MWSLYLIPGPAAKHHPGPADPSALPFSSALVSTWCCLTSSPGTFHALTCAPVWQVLPEGQLRASGRAVPVCRQHQPVHEHHRAAQQHLRLRAQPPGRCCSKWQGLDPVRRDFSSVFVFPLNSPFSSLSPFPSAQVFSHDVRLEEGLGREGVIRAGEEGSGYGRDKFPLPLGLSSHFSWSGFISC